MATFAGCSSAASSSGSTTTSSGPAVASTGSGCGRSIPFGSTTLSLSVDGFARVVIVHIPTGYSGSKHLALVLNMHGSGSNATEQELFSGMDATSDQYGFIVAYPQGDIAGGSGFDWNVPNEPLLGGAKVPSGAANDVTFLTDLVSQLAARYCIDLSRVYATGVSGGGRMASQLACDASGTFAAVAPVAGLRYPGPCPASRAVPIISFHGTADPIDPYNGHGEAYWTYSVPTAAQRWAAHDSCDPTAHVTTAAGYTLTAYAGCAGRSSVELFTVIGEGHEWPGGPKVPRSVSSVLGPQSSAVNANATMWAFFEAHPLA